MHWAAVAGTRGFSEAAGVVEVRGGLNARGVLLLCQSQETLAALGAILRQAGEIVVHHNGLVDAWNQVKSGAVGCVVLDAEAPASEALAFFRAVRSSARSCDTPFLFLITNEIPLPELDRWGPEVAPDAWLVLPCSADQFLQEIHKLLDHRRHGQAALMLATQGSTHAHGSGSQPAVRGGPQPAVSAPAKPAAPAPAASGDAVISPEGLLATPGSVFAGRLGLLDVTKIVSMIEPLRLTGVLRVSDGKRCGQVHFVEGAVRHAELHDIEGPDALFLLFHLKNGTFRFDEEAATGKTTIEGNTMSLLLEGLRQMDEAKALIKAFQHRRPSGQPPAAPVPAP